MTEAGLDLLKQALTVFRISDIRLYRQALCTERLHFFFTSSIRSVLRAQLITIWYPQEANFKATARPIPREEPVTRTVFSWETPHFLFLPFILWERCIIALQSKRGKSSGFPMCEV